MESSRSCRSPSSCGAGRRGRGLLGPAEAPHRAPRRAPPPVGLGFASRPKGLVPFHLESEGARTPFEEHLVEAALTVRAASGRTVVHFTVAEGARAGVRGAPRAAASRARAAATRPLRGDVLGPGPSTDTIAVDSRASRSGRRTAASCSVPAGTARSSGTSRPYGGDLVFVKNIDNVVPDARKGPTLLWKRLLAGAAPRGGDGAIAAPRALARTAATATARTRRSRSPPERSARRPPGSDRTPEDRCGVRRDAARPAAPGLRRRLERGRARRRTVLGAPATGARRGRSSRARRSTSRHGRAEGHLAARTHFNPVDLVVASATGRGRPYGPLPLRRPEAVFISRKSTDGRGLLALERPGLWNGAMAGWNTVFVEVPIETFAPVKTRRRPPPRPSTAPPRSDGASAGRGHGGAPEEPLLPARLVGRARVAERRVEGAAGKARRGEVPARGARERRIEDREEVFRVEGEVGDGEGRRQALQAGEESRGDDPGRALPERCGPVAREAGQGGGEAAPGALEDEAGIGGKDARALGRPRAGGEASVCARRSRRAWGIRDFFRVPVPGVASQLRTQRPPGVSTRRRVSSAVFGPPEEDRPPDAGRSADLVVPATAGDERPAGRTARGDRARRGDQEGEEERGGRRRHECPIGTQIFSVMKVPTSQGSRRPPRPRPRGSGAPVPRHGLLVRPVRRRQGVVDVADRHDPGRRAGSGPPGVPRG